MTAMRRHEDDDDLRRAGPRPAEEPAAGEDPTPLRPMEQRGEEDLPPDSPGEVRDHEHRTELEEDVPGGGPEGRTVAATTGPTAASAAAATAAPARQRSRSVWKGFSWWTVFFLAPALIILLALVVYPIFFTVVRSLYDAAGNNFVGLENYKAMFESGRTLTAIKNNLIWVLIAPALVTALGLVFAVLTERVSFATAFKVAVFMPMAISFLSAGVIWRLVYQDDPQLGLANAGLQAISKVITPPGEYPTARPSNPAFLKPQGQTYATVKSFTPGDTVELGIVAIPQRLVPKDATQASAPQPAKADSIAGTVWLDFTRGGGGEKNKIDRSEVGLPGMAVEAVRNGKVASSATAAADGSFVLKGLDKGQQYTVRLAQSNFREAWGGIQWLGPSLVTPSIIVSYIWIWAGFAMVLIGAGLAAIPRDVLEAARVDGANEWQVFRRVTAPLLAPVLIVVFVTLVINVLKIFDLVLIIPPGSVQADANVIALEMWRVSFGGGQNQGLGSALAILLFVLVIPAMIFNLRRFKADQ